MTEPNPILNNPYEEPNWHYATNLQGELDYTRPVKGRRLFTPEIQTIPVRQGSQGNLMEFNELAAGEHGKHNVNLLRREVSALMTATFPYYLLHDSEEGRRYSFEKGSAGVPPAVSGVAPETSSPIGAAALQKKSDASREGNESSARTQTTARETRALPPGCDLRQGFIYKKVPHVMLGSIANHEPPAEETLYDQPQEDKKRLRVAGPFTVETLQSYEPISPEELTRQRTEDKELGNFEDLIFAHLKSAGVKTSVKEENAVFVRIDRLANAALHAEGWYPAAGAPVSDPASPKTKSKHAGPEAGAPQMATVEIAGHDIYDPIKDEVKSRDVHDIAYWMLDDAYDGSNFVTRQVFFYGGDKDEFDDWKKGLSDLAKAATKKKTEQTLKLQIDDEAFSRIYGHTSHPFPAKKGQKIAVRVISQFGEETTKVLEVK